MYLWGDWTWMLLIPGMIISAIAQARVSSAFNRYSRVRTQNGVTGAQAAREIMQDSGLPALRSIKIVQIPGELTDNYNPSTKIMSLSSGVMDSATVAAVGVAAHETGHAIQDAVSYGPMRFRNAIVPVCNFASHASWPLFLVGLVFASRQGSFGLMLMDIGILLYCLALVFYLITLPVEFNASSRALKALNEYQILQPDELQGARRVLQAAALTYVASMFTALLTLVRLLVLRGRRD